MRKSKCVLFGALTVVLLGSFTQINAETLSNLFRKPGVIGDSLSQGFFGATVESKTQGWAYPVVMSKQAGSNVSYNKLKGPFINLEDTLKGNCGVICLVKTLIGGNESTVSTPTHAGITGADYSDTLKKSGQCEDIYAKKWAKDWYWKKWYWYTYRWVEVADCQKPDKYHRFGLRSSGTQLQIMEKINPSFIFGSVGANHVLCTALAVNLDCLDAPRFRRDIPETFARLRGIASVRGGVVFTVPNVTSIAYLDTYSDPRGRANYSGLKAFYRTQVSSPSQVLDNSEIATITNFLNELNALIKNQSARNNYALADARAVFDDIKENGRVIRSSSGYSPGMGHANWPLPGKPGIFGLDGVHPNKYGHSVLANELITVTNQKYGVNIPQIDEYAAWYYDSLNRDPVDLKRFLSDSIVGKVISYLINTFM